MVNYFLVSVLRISTRFKILFRFYRKVFFVLGKSVTLVLCLKTKTLSLVSFKRFCYFVQGSLKRGSFCGVCELRQFGSGAFSVHLFVSYLGSLLLDVLLRFWHLATCFCGVFWLFEFCELFVFFPKWFHSIKYILCLARIFF